MPIFHSRQEAHHAGISEICERSYAHIQHAAHMQKVYKHPTELVYQGGALGIVPSKMIQQHTQP
jgi:hypothetical protein